MMRTLAHAIRIRTYARIPYSKDARAHGVYARLRTLCARTDPPNSTPSGNAPRLRCRGCVPLVQGAALSFQPRSLRLASDPHRGIG